MQTLDPMTLPLHGRQLIEASAGTGKTFTIALIYLRLLLEKHLQVNQILVVTFTTNATEELRERIRNRIRQALDFLTGQSQCDPLLASLIETTEPDRSKNITLLNDALTNMDEAAIHTIHGFCQRMLQEHAFESNTLFSLDFLESEQDLRQSIIEDFWRIRFYGAPLEEVGWIAEKWKNPTGLLNSISIALAQSDVSLIPKVERKELSALEKQCLHLYNQILKIWKSESAAIIEILEKDKNLSKNKSSGYHPFRVEQALAEMQQLTGEKKMPWVLPKTAELFCSSYMAKNLKGKRIQPQHLFFNLFDEFYTLLQNFLALYSFYIQQDAYHYLGRELSRRKDDHGAIYFNDLLIKLDSALQGGNGKYLAQIILKRYPAALVDEFQDTDPLQYRIFKTIYSPAPNNALFLIGDPKQAIYSFRGADIFTYIRARRDTPPANRFTMDSNYRATSSMVEAVNTLFSGNSPFLFDNDIQFKPVNSGGRTDTVPLLIDGRKPCPLNCLLLPTERLATSADRPISKNKASTAAALLCSFTIAKLLNKGAGKQAVIGSRPLCDGDIAILVRTHSEAALMRNALIKYGITSVYHSQESIFSSEEARQFQQLLTALINPTNDALVCNCLISLFFGMNGVELYHLRQNPREWEKILIGIREFAEIWKLQGFMSMFQALLIKEKLVSRVLAEPEGERQLTNLIQLAELLQEASDNHPGRQGLLRWLAEQRSFDEKDSISRQLRLESDENLVRIVTYHKAKGLEYPIVFLPFIWNGRQLAKEGPLPFHDPDTLQFQIDMGTGSQEHYLLAEKERMAEDLRLLYVALTRARYCCYFCWGRINSMEKSAFSYLLNQNPENWLNELQKDFDNTSSKIDGELLHIHQYPESLALKPHCKEAGAELFEPKTFKGTIPDKWRISSYSKISTHPLNDNTTPNMEGSLSLKEQQTKKMNPFTFPRGTAAGTCLHAILEELDFPDASGESFLNLVERHLERGGFDPIWTEAVCHWLGNVLDTRLEKDENFVLRQLNHKDRINELAFHFSLDNLSGFSFNIVLDQYDIQPVLEQSLPKSGLMHGFIDMVFRHKGRYFIADYKSNYLGPDIGDYQHKSLQAAILDHRYDIQYLIYTLALNRYLSQKLSDYKYERDFGGIYYLFLRGMDRNSPFGNGIFKTVPDKQLIEGLDRCCLGIEI